jgi:hypothetical protein
MNFYKEVKAISPIILAISRRRRKRFYIKIAENPLYFV